MNLRVLLQNDFASIQLVFNFNCHHAFSHQLFYCIVRCTNSGGYGGGGGYGGSERPRGACYAFQEGNCRYGDSCRFSHDGGAAGGGGGYRLVTRHALKNNVLLCDSH
jgi:CCCH-type zinc finger